MRAIDADAMLVRLEEWNTSDSTDKALYNFTLNRIQEQPTIEPEQKTGKWIPCSERLPEEDGCYLVTTTGTNNDIIDIAYYTTGLWHKASRIKAWMPLPEPYKGGEPE